MAYENIPLELRGYAQWCVWKFEESDSGKPTKVPYDPRTHKHADVTDPRTYCTFEQAVNAFGYSGIGFILTDADPFAFIDLDAPKNCTPEEEAKVYDRQHKIYENFNSYAERSPSGNGLHIIVKGSIPNGRKRSSIEIYSSERYMTMTGDVFRDAPITDHNELLNSMWSEMGKGQDARLFYAGLSEAKMTDEQVLDMAATASNGEKFVDLYRDGNWQKYYPSQSEADFALVDIIAFYSQNRMQVQKLFLQSKLAERQKSRRQYAINYMLNRCFDKMLPPVDFEGLRDQVNAAIQKSMEAAQKREAIERDIATRSHIIAEDTQHVNLELPQELPDDMQGVYVPPEGLVGMIAKFIYAQAPLPVPEIALAAAIGLMSGVIGKAYNISATGLNQYTLLLAATGTGKESAAQGIAKLMSEVVKIAPTANEFLGPSEIASPQALTKYLANKPSVISIVGEFGLQLKQMGSENAPPHMMGLKRLILDLFNKSGEGNKMQQMIYSDAAKNTDVLSAPSFSIFGESAPERFYEALTENMISEGLLPRFTIIEYHGDRVMPNEGASLVRPSPELIQAMATLCANAANLISQRKVLHVQQNEGAKKILKDFQMLAHRNIVGSMEVRRQLWNRAHIKALKLAATVAVGMHPFQPVIDEAAAEWAIKIVVADVKNMLKRFETGDVGINNEETKQLQLLTKLIRKFVTSPWKDLEKVTGEKFAPLHAERIVPYSYLQRNTSTAPAFKKDRMGATNALKRAIKTMEERGDIQQMQRSVLMTKFSTTAQSYAINNPKAFEL